MEDRRRTMDNGWGAHDEARGNSSGSKYPRSSELTVTVLPTAVATPDVVLRYALERSKGIKSLAMVYRDADGEMVVSCSIAPDAELAYLRCVFDRYIDNLIFEE